MTQRKKDRYKETSVFASLVSKDLILRWRGDAWWRCSSPFPGLISFPILQLMCQFSHHKDLTHNAQLLLLLAIYTRISFLNIFFSFEKTLIRVWSRSTCLEQILAERPAAGLCPGPSVVILDGLVLLGESGLR